ncbi:MAG: mechanosensitive ion channel family protein [Gemmatimonadetes bacterium]|nr:mechanosensitive ion channel family protein [Gemmatimonadota bacterium]
MSDLLGFDISAIDFAALYERAVAFALPRLGESLLLLVLVGLFYMVARSVMRRVRARLSAGDAEPDVKEILVDLVRRVLLTPVAFWAFWRLAQIWELRLLELYLVGVWLVALTLPISHTVSGLLSIVEKRVASKTETKIDDTALPWVNRIVRWTIIGTGVMVALNTIGLNITPLLAGAGVAGVAISFAAQDTLSNLIAGVLLIIDRPFQVGDRIELWMAPNETGTWGDVIEIGLRATKIRNPDNLVVVVPNNEIMRRDIVNYTMSGAHIRLRIPFGIAYESDIERTKEVLIELAGETDGVKLDPAPVVIVRGFGPSEVNLQLRVWIQHARERRAIADRITEAAMIAFAREGIEIPYPKREVFLKSSEASVAAPD